MKRMDHEEYLLVVDDDLEIRELLQQFLQSSGFPNILTAADGKEAREILDQHSIDLIILDIMLPGEDGFSVATSIREESLIPILMLSARTEPSDRIHGLELGADDYLTKPFEPEELLARIHAIFRRTHCNELEHEQNLSFGGITLLMPERTIIRKDRKKVPLTSAEFKLLSLFLSNPNQPLSRERLSEGVVGKKTAISPRAVDVQISRLRSRLGDHNSAIIQTVRNEGYILPVKIKPQKHHVSS